MPSAFKTAAVVGKSDAASLPDVLDQLSALLRRHGLKIVMDPPTARASRASSAPADTRSSWKRKPRAQ